jgi:hypothetical protein
LGGNGAHGKAIRHQEADSASALEKSGANEHLFSICFKNKVVLCGYVLVLSSGF